jgi:sialic acid synthase SpsE
MRARRKINAGETICKEDFIPLRPCENDDVNPYLFEEIIGKTVLNDIDSDQALKKSNVL